MPVLDITGLYPHSYSGEGTDTSNIGHTRHRDQDRENDKIKR
jgi:hypothetical protein